MPYTAAQKRATMKYLAEQLEEVRFRVKRGERAALREEAEANNQSVTQYVIQSINQRAGKKLLTPSEAEKDGDGL